MTPPEEIEREKYRKIGFGVDGISQKDITNPELFYPTITEKVIERLRVSPSGSMRTNEIRRDLSSFHNLEDPGIQGRIIQSSK